jgi:hypothetical protein
MKKLTLTAFTLIALAALIPLLPTTRAAEEPAEAAGFKSLFNGHDLTNWDGDPACWSVQDGVITGRTTAEHPIKKNTFLIYKDAKPADFELHASFKISNHNSGIQYRSKDEGDHVVSGYQADIVGDTPDKYTGILYEERGRGILAERGQQVTIDDAGHKTTTPLPNADDIMKAIKKNDWNDYVITAQGNHIVQKINGVTTVDVTDNQSDKAAKEGILALQIHAGPPMTVQFKDIKLKTLEK